MRKIITLIAGAAIVATSLVACKNNSDQASSTPSSTAPAAEELVLTAASPKVGNWKGVGQKEAGKLVTNGTAGYLMFGPYAAMKAGTYNVVINGSLTQLADGQKLVFDAVSNKGSKRLGMLEVKSVPESPTDVLAQFTATLPEDVTDLEIRANVPDSAVMSISGYSVKK